MQNKRKKYRVFYQLEEHLEIPMFLLAFCWLYLFIVELFYGLGNTQEGFLYGIWILFIVEYLLKLYLAPRKLSYIKYNWITVISLIIPAFRAFRLFYALRILRSVRVINSTRIIRALTSGKRFLSALKEAQGPQPTHEMNVGILVAIGKPDNKEAYVSFTKQLIEDVKGEIEESTGLPWYFDITDSVELKSDNSRSPADFLDKASLEMVEKPYDLMCVITDVPLRSLRQRMEPGLVSLVSRIMVISTRELMVSGRNNTELRLEDTRIQNNSALLFLHLTGHLLGLEHTPLGTSRIMGTDDFTRDFNTLPSFSDKERKVLSRNIKHAPERELKNGNLLEVFVFHILMTLRNPKDFFSPLLKNWAVFLPLSLPGLATAAFAPAIILIFNAEIWDVGLGMTNLTAGFFAVASIMFGSFYLVNVQSLFLPRKNKKVLTEHLAVTNSVIYFSLFFACIGLFFMVCGLILIIEFYVFPEDLMQTWPTLSKPEILLQDRIRLAVFISTIGVTTGALAGGLESRKVIQHLALFRSRV
ncbi:MAG: hypothetical protein WD267_09130 [Balneolales bacterium]